MGVLCPVFLCAVLGGQERKWSKGRIGRDSGYQYRLQNAEMGLILLIKNHNIKVDTLGSHLKIEVSPHALDGADPHILQGVLDDLAAAVLSHCHVRRDQSSMAHKKTGHKTAILWRATKWAKMTAAAFSCKARCSTTRG